MSLRRRTGAAVLAALLSLITAGCQTVRPWEREQLSLAPMQPDASRCTRFERSVEVYREGAVGANGGKSGGGCGCT
jgi:uncharacterized protein DUF4266